MVTLNLESQLKALRQSPSYTRNDHASTTLINLPGLGAVLVALPKGGHLKEHRASRPIAVSVVEGSVLLELGNRTIEMRRGDVTALAPRLRHTITGLEDSAFLLTMGGASERSSST